MENQLVNFLRIAKKSLKSWEKTTTRASGTASFIILMDNVSGRGEDYTTPDTQRVRTQRNIERILGKAGLTRYKTTKPHELIKGFEKTVLWVLV